MKWLRSILYSRVYFSNGWQFRFWKTGGYIIFLGFDWQTSDAYGRNYRGGWELMFTILNFNMLIEQRDKRYS